jgi:hypothetical protein
MMAELDCNARIHKIDARTSRAIAIGPQRKTANLFQLYDLLGKSKSPISNELERFFGDARAVVLELYAGAH